MSDWKNYIKELKKEWIGQKVEFEGKTYNVVDVDMNGAIIIDKPTKNPTTAIEAWKIKDGVYTDSRKGSSKMQYQQISNKHGGSVKYEQQHKYELVSQGILCGTLDDKHKALEIAEKNNKKWWKYCQKCMDNGEDYADNAMEVYEDGVLIADKYGLKNNDSSINE